jgi:hypothetical protein
MSDSNPGNGGRHAAIGHSGRAGHPAQARHLGRTGVGTGSLAMIVAALLICALAGSGCASVRAPRALHPEPEMLSRHVYGAWLLLEVGRGDQTYETEGEFLGLGGPDVVLLVADGPVRVHRDSIESAAIDVHARNTGLYAGWMSAGALSTLSHGYFLVFTAPAWLIVGGVCTITADHAGYHRAVRPSLAWWRSMAIYARYPQGTEALGLDSLRPIRVVVASP